jgi:dolichol-phosphate mannosyltransferase
VALTPNDKLALIIPTLGEAGNLGPLLGRVRQALEPLEIPWEVLVVDDDSRDGTDEIVSAIAYQDARVRLLVRRQQRGLAGAILHGWRHTGASILGVMDADGQHPAEILPMLVGSILEGRDLVIASRYAAGGRFGWNLVRRVVSILAIAVARPLHARRLRVCDPLSGFFLVRTGAVRNISFQTAGFKLLLEILVRGRVDTVEEVPFAFARRRAGRSKVSLRVAWDYVTLLAKLYVTKCVSLRAQRAGTVFHPKA